MGMWALSAGFWVWTRQERGQADLLLDVSVYAAASRQS